MNSKNCSTITKPYLESIDGFKTVAKKINKYTDSSNAKLELVLNKYGYIEGEGWSFIVRLTDPRAEDEFGVVDYNGQANFDGGWVKGVLDEDQFKIVYGTEYHPTDRLIDEYDLWIPFLNAQHLDLLFQALTPHLQRAVATWLSDVRNKPITNVRDIHPVDDI